jgi:hypothetical protein
VLLVALQDLSAPLRELSAISRRGHGISAIFPYEERGTDAFFDLFREFELRAPRLPRAATSAAPAIFASAALSYFKLLFFLFRLGPGDDLGL